MKVFEKHGVEAAPVPRPRRHRRPRRRPQLRRDPGAAAGQRERPDPHHRTGRGDRQQVFQSRDRPAQPGDADRRHAGSHAAEPRRACIRPEIAYRESWKRCPRMPTRPIANWCTRRPGSSRSSAPPRRSPRSPSCNIGSRPSSRKTSDRIEDLRAIPWVFSWGLNRIMLPGWFGFGSAVEKFVERDGDAGPGAAQAMYRNWPFFRGLMSNMDMVLSKTDMGIASRYAELVADAELRERIFGVIQTEWQRTIGAPAGDHRPTRAAAGQSAVRAQLPQPPTLHRSAQPLAGRIAAAPPRRRE